MASTSPASTSPRCALPSRPRTPPGPQGQGRRGPMTWRRQAKTGLWAVSKWKIHGFYGIFMDFMGFSWDFMGFSWILWDFPRNMVMKVGVEGWDLIGSSGPGNCVSHFVPYLENTNPIVLPTVSHPTPSFRSVRRSGKPLAGYCNHPWILSWRAVIAASVPSSISPRNEGNIETGQHMTPPYVMWKPWFPIYIPPWSQTQSHKPTQIYQKSLQ